MAKATGVPMRAERASIYIRSSLFNAIDRPTPRVVRVERMHSRPPIKPTDPMTDKALAQMRGDYELRGLWPTACAKKYGICKDRAMRLLLYLTRSHIDPV